MCARKLVSNGWVFSNLTYLPLMKRSEWKGNPLAATGSWTAKDGRRWYTAATGRNGCRSYAEADVITALPGGGFREQRICLFKNIVMFAQVPSSTEPPATSVVGGSVVSLLRRPQARRAAASPSARR